MSKFQGSEYERVLNEYRERLWESVTKLTAALDEIEGVRNVTVLKGQVLGEAPLGELRRVSLRPDDQLVLRYPGVLSEASIARLRAAFEEVFPERKVLVLEQGIELQVVGPPDESPLREVLGQAWAMLERGSHRKEVIEMIAHALGMDEPPVMEE